MEKDALLGNEHIKRNLAASLETVMPCIPSDLPKRIPA